jgi:hypothetical protein
MLTFSKQWVPYEIVDTHKVPKRNTRRWTQSRNEIPDDGQSPETKCQTMDKVRKLRNPGSISALYLTILISLRTLSARSNCVRIGEQSSARPNESTIPAFILKDREMASSYFKEERLMSRPRVEPENLQIHVHRSLTMRSLARRTLCYSSKCTVTVGSTKLVLKLSPWNHRNVSADFIGSTLTKTCYTSWPPCSLTSL